MAIEGVVTANNAFGEFPYSLIVEDQSGAIELNYDSDEVNCITLGAIVGSTVKISCGGLWIGSTGGMLAIGDEPSGEYPTTNISLSDFILRVKLCDIDPIIPIPQTLKISELTTDHILTYVCVENLSVVLSEGSCTTFCSRSTTTGLTEYTSHTLVDTQGDQITLTVSSSVRYADDNLPDGLFDAYAIVEYFNGQYRLRIVNCGY